MPNQLKFINSFNFNIPSVLKPIKVIKINQNQMKNGSKLINLIPTRVEFIHSLNPHLHTCIDSFTFIGIIIIIIIIIITTIIILCFSFFFFHVEFSKKNVCRWLKRFKATRGRKRHENDAVNWKIMRHRALHVSPSISVCLSVFPSFCLSLFI